MSASTAAHRAQQLVQHLTSKPAPATFTTLPTPTPHIVCQAYPNGLAHLILNRPKAYNALSPPMCQALLTHLSSFLSPPASPSTPPVRLVLLTSAGPTGVFCSGGDVAAVTQLTSSSHLPSPAATPLPEPFRFFAIEYSLNHLLASYPLPVLAVMDGVTMGGGCGLALHCSHRIATARTVVAMPECSIGLVPDVGGTYFLPRWPGAVGMWAGLTSSRLDGVDAMYVGAANMYVEVEQVDGLVRNLQSVADWGSDRTTVCRSVEKRLRRWQSSSWQARPGYVERHRDYIDRCFSQPTLHSLLSNLNSIAHSTHRPTEPVTHFARHCLILLRTKCPTSLQLTHAALTLSRTAHLPLSACLQLEYRLVSRLCRQPHGGDFAAGVRAVLVDKRREGAEVGWMYGWRSGEEVEWFMSALEVGVEGEELRLDEAESAERPATRVDDSWTQQR